MSPYVTMADLGRRGRGGGRRWGGGGRRWGGYYGGYYPWYDAVYPSPLVVMDPVDPQNEADIKKAKEAEAKLKELAEKEKIKAIAAAVRDELAKSKGLGQGGNYIDVMGPGARDTEIDVEARSDEVIDETISARDALLWRQQAGLVGMGQAPAPTSGAAPPAEQSFWTVKRVGMAVGGAIAVGLIGYIVARKRRGI